MLKYSTASRVTTAPVRSLWTTQCTSEQESRRALVCTALQECKSECTTHPDQRCNLIKCKAAFSVVYRDDTILYIPKSKEKHLHVCTILPLLHKVALKLNNKSLFTSRMARAWASHRARVTDMDWPYDWHELHLHIPAESSGAGIYACTMQYSSTFVLKAVSIAACTIYYFTKVEYKTFEPFWMVP